MDKKSSKADRDELEDNLPKWGEVLRKVMSVGLGAAFMTEESVRSALSGLNLPKEVLTSILQSANRSKEDLLNRVGNETIKLLSKIDFVKEASRFVEEHKFRIQAEIEVVKKSDRSESEPTLALQTEVKIKD
ncbi:MAG: hypothetical protein AB7F86_01100 [Bdellovibrionales bacterium]